MDELGILIRTAVGQRSLRFLLDFDGTLCPLVEDPASAILSLEARQVLAGLATLGEVVIISGRAQPFLELIFEGLPVALAAEHGAFYRPDENMPWQNVFEGITQRGDAHVALRKELKAISAKFNFALVEEKKHSTTFHFRQIKHSYPLTLWEDLAVDFRSMASRHGFDLLRGKDVFEFRSVNTGKGHFVRWLDSILRTDLIVAAGDDLTDEEMFDVINELGGESIKVGEGVTSARWRVDSPQQLLDFIASLLI